MSTLRADGAAAPVGIRKLDEGSRVIQFFLDAPRRVHAEESGKPFPAVPRFNAMHRDRAVR